MIERISIDRSVRRVPQREDDHARPDVLVFDVDETQLDNRQPSRSDDVAVAELMDPEDR